MFLFHAILAKPDTPYMDKLERMADYLHALMGPARALAMIGDDDGGRFFHPYGRRELFGRASMATASAVLERSDWPFDPEDLLPQAVWWLGAGVLHPKAGAGKLPSPFPSASLIPLTTAGAYNP